MALRLVVDPQMGHQIVVTGECFRTQGTGVGALTSMLLKVKIHV